MDRIHNVDTKPWISQKRCNIKELTRERHSILNEYQVSLNPSFSANRRKDCERSNSDPARQLEREDFDDLTLKLESFVADNQKQVNSYFLFNLTDEKFLTIEPECELKMYQLQLEHAKRMISDRMYKVNYLSCLKTTRRETLMRYLTSLNRTNQSTVSANSDDATKAAGSAAAAMTTSVSSIGNEVSEQIDINSLAVILVVQMWPQPTKNGKLKLEKEILFRSDQCLTDLRDQFKCPRDYGVPMDLSENPEQQTDRVFCGELFKSGFFLIEDTFYNDMRDSNNTDLSASIVDWASEEVTVVGEDGRNCKVSRGIGPFKRVKMEETKFEDLTIRLGLPYVYYHQGNCEHLFTISDIRYATNDAKLSQSKFPYVSATSIGRNEDHLRCYMCKQRPPHWYTRNNTRLPVDPFFFCENCFLSFNYDKDKKKIGKFQAYLYTSAYGIPDSVIMGANKC